MKLSDLSFLLNQHAVTVIITTGILVMILLLTYKDTIIPEIKRILNIDNEEDKKILKILRELQIIVKDMNENIEEKHSIFRSDLNNLEEKLNTIIAQGIENKHCFESFKERVLPILDDIQDDIQEVLHACNGEEMFGHRRDVRDILERLNRFSDVINEFNRLLKILNPAKRKVNV